ncbi:MAG: aldehyde-activating protein [Hyphomicrobiales bacterium]|nr:MAG: aldehyde-activating protein [Hyphomicrobiales bacterium]
MSETLTGSCHCGEVEFEVVLDVPLDDPAMKLARCNCSLCRRRQVVMAAVPLSNLRVTKGEDKLTLYQWNTEVAKHYFCSVCGIYTHHQRRSDPTVYGFNMACMDGVDPYGFGEIKVVDGQKMSSNPK